MCFRRVWITSITLFEADSAGWRSNHATTGASGTVRISVGETLIGQSARQVGRGKKGLSMAMVQRLRARFRVPPDLLLPPPKKVPSTSAQITRNQIVEPLLATLELRTDD